MLRLILGAGGTGKTTAIYNRIQELVQAGESEILLLVPDQSTFETEKALLDLLGAKQSKAVEAFGFEGMCRHVFALTHNVLQNVIDNGTRAVLMSLALEQLTEKLAVLPTKRNRAVAELLLETLSACKKSAVTTDMLREAAQKTDDKTLSAKLSETALVFDTFDALLAQSYIDPLDNLERLKNILLENNDIFRNRVLFIDAFSGFTAAQLEIIRILLNRCREVNAALTLDPFGSKSEDVFKVSHETADQLLNLAKRDSIEIKTPVRLEDPLRFASDSLSQLAQSVFRRHPEVSENTPDNIVLYSAADLTEECEFVARRIKELILHRGLRYRDISVICRDVSAYRGVLGITLEKYGIPYFMDAQDEVSVKPAVRFINAVFRLLLDGFRREDMLSLLKTGLTQFSEKEISNFENYVYIWNLSGKALCAPFTLNPKGYAEEFTEQDKRRLQTAETVRKTIAEPLLAFRESAKGKTGREITKLLYRLLESLHIPDALSDLYDTLEAAGSKGLGEEQIRVWSLLMDALDKTVAAVGDMPLSMERYYELLSLQISNIEFSKIPQMLDSVTVTTAQRVRGTAQRAAFLIGCADGDFPAVPHTSGLFSDFEIKQLLLNDIAISDDYAYVANLELFMAYSAVVSPSEYLFASCPAVNMEGERKKPSAIFAEITKVFPTLCVRDKSDYDSRADAMTALTPAFEEYARSLASGHTELSGLKDFFENEPRYRDGCRAIQRALDKAPFKIENPQNARLLFGENLTVSASQVEKFSKCRFSYFCNYGLGIRERKKAEIDPSEYGTLVHYILEQFFTKYSKKEYSQLSDNQLKAFIRTAVSAYLEGYLGGSDSKAQSFLYRLEVLCGNLFLLLSHIIAELSQSDFDVADCELKIGQDIPAYTVQLPTGQNVAVCGSVDRVDVMHTDNGAYLRIIDYKTGGKTFRLSDILFGLNLQMLLYLCSIHANGAERYGETIPAGILYMPAVVPNIIADGLSEDKINEKIDADFKMNGLLLDDVRVIKGMDKTEGAKYIPIKIKGGSNVKSDSLATLEQMGKLFRKLNDTVGRMGEKLYDGDIAAVPLKGGADACEYCPYGSVCAYRQGDPVTVFSMKADEVYEQLDSEQGGEQ